LGRVIFGPGALNRLGELAALLGNFHNVLVVTDPGLAKVGHPQRAVTLLSNAGFAVHVFDEVKENPTERQVIAGTDFARDRRIELIVALGGGSSMDCAKGINFLLTNGGRMADYKGHGKATEPMLPSIGIPTTSGTGSEAQSYALITDETTHMKMACGDRKAAFRIAVLDPELTLSQPRGVTAVTAIDALAHAVESFACTKRTPLSMMASRTAWSYLEPNLETVLAVPGNLAARGAMQLGAHFAGMAIENAMLGICHSCANPLTAHYGLTHGIAIGILLPHVVRFNAEHQPHLYDDLAASAEHLALRLTALTEAAGMPTSLKECEVSRTILPLLAEEANQQWTARFNPRTVDDAALLSVYEAAW